ncbi:MAG TPA: type VI secretion system baseplate subunit TssG, partial [Panacibacter sp.]|nr:type VI secretion system baseplate subunit TssG [Panacibacter sp.]
IENIMQMIFSVPVKICLREQAPLYPGEPFFSRLGEVGLGVSLAAGAVYNEGEDEVLITIGPISNQLMQQFMHNNRNEKILQLLIDYFLPVHLDTVTEFVLNENDKTARLADVASELNSELGVDVWL